MLKNILVIDSGVGAISIVNEIKKLLSANFLIYIDNKNAPLGNKTTCELNKIADNIVDYATNLTKIDLVVIACNTLTTSSINYLRKKYNNIEFVGTEPNIKFKEYPAIVLCTKYTHDNCKILNNVNCDKLALPKLSSLIDTNLEDLNNCEIYLNGFIPLLEKYKSISLGCTHYTYIKKFLKDKLPNIKIYENKYGVAKRVENLLNINGNLQKSKIKIILSKKDDKFKKSLLKYLS